MTNLPPTRAWGLLPGTHHPTTHTQQTVTTTSVTRRRTMVVTGTAQVGTTALTPRCTRTEGTHSYKPVISSWPIRCSKTRLDLTHCLLLRVGSMSGSAVP